jgi:hypothetical protein
MPEVLSHCWFNGNAWSWIAAAPFVLGEMMQRSFGPLLPKALGG